MDNELSRVSRLVENYYVTVRVIVAEV